MSNESHPSRRTEDEFSAAFGDLLTDLTEQMTDPHVTELHKDMADAIAYLETEPENLPEVLKELVGMADRKWQYMNEKLKVTAPIWVLDRGTGQFITSTKLENKEVTSKGFTIQRKGIASTVEEVEKLPFHAAHYVHLAPSEQWPQGAHGVIFINDITHLEPPFPSRELREQDLRYYNPEIIEQIDSLVEQADRPDQTFKTIQDLVIPADNSIEKDDEMMRNAASYLSTKMSIDSRSTYRMELKGHLLLQDDEGDIYGHEQEDPIRYVTQILSLRLLPHPEVIGTDIPGTHDYIAYLNVRVLDPHDSVMDTEILVPCRSIVWISASRYDQSLDSTYHEDIPDDK